ncbi:Anaphase-promoting complex subunit 2 [Halotydeus destructor]|nr:Anaphase-promoting complex subunit 2 [Halotydeus destructor]
MALSDLDQAWNIIASPSWLSKGPDLPQNDVLAAVDVLYTNNFVEIFLDWYVEKFRVQLNRDLIPKFWSELPEDDFSDKSNSATFIFKFVSAVEELYHASRRWIHNPVLGLCMKNGLDAVVAIERKLSQLVTNILISSSPVHFNDYVLLCYSTCFKISQCQKYRKKLDETVNSVDADDSFNIGEHEFSFSTCEDGCPVCGKKLSDSSCDDMDGSVESLGKDQAKFCHCSQLMEAFDHMNHHLKEMGLHDTFSHDAVVSIIHAHIKKHVKHKCHGIFYSSFLDKLEKWVQNNVIEWLTVIYKADEKFITESEDRLMHLMYEVYAQIRIDQLFEIIVEFPDSVPAIEDLKHCLEKCHGVRSSVISTLRSSLEARLLHPGVATNDILTAYIQTIKALRLLDPAGVILQLVCDPIKNYLKNKEDTVRCIITALTDENSDLIPELVKSVPQSGDDPSSPSDDEYIVKNWQSWKPDPVDAAQAPKNSKSMRSSDIVSILVNVYESKDLFVEEYQRLLAQRFLANFDCNVEFERRNLELLTLKFGESDLNSCEVMLHDMIASKRLDKRVNSGEIKAHHPLDFPINCLILSAEFWPKKFGLTSDELNGLKLPEPVSDAMSKYTKAFESMKVPRTLEWKSHVGLVQIELEFNEHQVTFTVTPIQASIMFHFQEKEIWKISELAEVLGVAASVVRRKIVFWQNKGILRDIDNDEYQLVEDQSGQGQASENQAMNVDGGNDEETFEAVSDMASEETALTNKDNEKFRVLWSFIENMLTNLNSLPLERIHSMLLMFAFQGSTDDNELTTQELRHFLEKKVREQKLVYSGGQYSLQAST